VSHTWTEAYTDTQTVTAMVMSNGCTCGSAFVTT
jgi:hypothetical protein